MNNKFLTLILASTVLAACVEEPNISNPQTTWYADTDGDNYGDPNNSFVGDQPDNAWVSNSDDCDDGDNSVNPAATETKDGIDENCNGIVDEDLYIIGDTGPAGGIVFYVDNISDFRLEAAPEDQLGAFGKPDFGCLYVLIGSSETTIGSGARNTIKISDSNCLSNEGPAFPTAIELVEAYSLNGYTDWFLPSKDELNELWIQKDLIGGFVGSTYFSSSENDAYSVHLQNIGNGSQFWGDKYLPQSVRAIRSF